MKIEVLLLRKKVEQMMEIGLKQFIPPFPGPSPPITFYPAASAGGARSPQKQSPGLPFVPSLFPEGPHVGVLEGKPQLSDTSGTVKRRLTIVK